jgi:SWI/SNF-related matrix-associated actin-dependent regulator 1 of chromatin subfamily A
MTIELRPYQAEGAAWLTSRNGVLAWKPGVGKTFTALEAARRVGGSALYLCPPTIRWQVADEAGRLGLSAQVIDTGAQRLSTDAQIVVTSYNLAAATPIWKQLFARKWGSITLDEAHGLKDHTAKRTVAIYGAKFGHVTDEGKPLNRNEWVDEFCTVRNEGFGDKIVGGKNLDKLRAILEPWVNQRELEGLPGLSIDHIPLKAEQISMEGLDPAVVGQVAKLLPLLDENDGALSAIEPALATIRQRIATAKAREVASLVETECRGGTDKLIVFGHHKEALEILRATCQAKGLHPVLISGKVTGRARVDAIVKFQHEPKCKVAIINIRAGGVGLNLQVADRVIFLEADWTPAMNDQAIARAYRSGQSKPVRVSFVSLKGSVDEQVTSALKRKAAIIRKVLQ